MKAHTKSAIHVIRRNKPFCRAVASVSAATFLLISAAPAFAGTTSVLGGNAVLTGMERATLDSNGANAAAFSSSYASAVLDWSKFNIGSGQSMSFNGAGTTFFNLVDSAAGKSQIDGIINGSGNVWVINPAGIAFGANSSVNVGGLFAAAAGNLGNADALRDGTAMTPSFSSFAGEVDATKGTFVADQIALMGGKVSVGGDADFSGAFKVDVGAGNHLIVDDVGGGMVSVDMSQFADAANDVLDISGLVAGDALVDVVVNGNVKATGDIQAGRLQVMAANDVALDADVKTSMGEVNVGSLNKGDITLSGVVNAADAVSIMANDGLVRVDDTGSVGSQNAGISIVAGVGAGAQGTVEVAGGLGVNGGNGNIVIAAGQDTAPGGGTGFGVIDVSGEIINEGSGSVALSAGKSGVVSSGVTYGYVVPGDIKIENGAIVRTAGGDVMAVATRNVSVSGSVVSERTLSIMAGAGVDGSVSVAGALSARGATTLSAGIGQSQTSGSIVMNEGSVSIQNGGGVLTDGTLQIVAVNDVSVNGLASAKQIQVAAMENFSVGSGGDVRAGDGGLEAAAGTDASLSQGQILSDGSIDIEAGRDISLAGSEMMSDFETTLSAKRVKIDGHVQSHGYVEIEAEDSIEIGGGAAVKTDGDDGSVYLQAGMATYDGDELVGVSGGDITVGEGAFVAADGKWGAVNLHAVDGAVDVKGTLIAANEGVIDVTTGFADKGGVCAPEATPVVLNNGGDVNIGASSRVVAQDVWITSRGGKVDVRGNVVGSGCVSLDGDGVTSSGTIDVRQGTLEVYGNRGDINLYNKASGVVYAGDIILVAEGNVIADNPNNMIGKVTEAKAGPGKVLRINLGGGGDDFETVEIGNIVSDTAYLRSEKGTIKVVGDITAPDEVVLETEEGDIIVMENCTVTALDKGDGAVVRLNAGRDIVNNGNLVSAGTVKLVAGRDITGEGKVAAEGSVTAAAGGSVRLTAEDGIRLGNGEKGNVAVEAANGDVDISTVRGDIVVDGIVQSEAENGTVLLRAATDENENGGIIVNENGALDASLAGGSVIGIAGYGKLAAEAMPVLNSAPQALKAVAFAQNLLGAENDADSSSIRIADAASVAAGKRVVLEGRVSVISSGRITTQTAEIIAHEGVVNQTGAVSADGISVAAQDGIYVNSLENSIGGLDSFELDGAFTGDNVEIVLNASTDPDSGEAVPNYAAICTGGNLADFNKRALTGTIVIIGDEDGLISSDDTLVFTTVDGDIVVARNCTVKTSEGKGIQFQAGRDVNIGGKVESGGDLLIVAGHFDLDDPDLSPVKGNVMIGENARVHADGNLDIGLPEKSYYDIETMWAFLCGEHPVLGDVTIDGMLSAGGSSGIYAYGKIESGESASVAVAGAFDAFSTYSHVLLNGQTRAGTVNVDAGGDVALGDVLAHASGQLFSLVDGTIISGGISAHAGRALTVRPDASIVSQAADGHVYLNGDQGLTIGDGAEVLAGFDGAGKKTGGATADLYVTAGVSSSEGVEVFGALDVNGTLKAACEALVMASGGDATVGENGVISGGTTAFVESMEGVRPAGGGGMESLGGRMVMNGRVESGDAAFVSAMRKTGGRDAEVILNGTVSGANSAMVDTDNGSIRINGKVLSEGRDGYAIVVADKSGDIVFGTGGQAKGTAGVMVKTGDGDLMQENGGQVNAARGYASSVSLPAAVVGDGIVLQVNGSIGSSDRAFAVDGNVVGLVSDDAQIAAASGKDLRGGVKPFEVLSLPTAGGDVVTFDLTELNVANAMFVGRDLSVYSAGQIQKGNVFEAGRNLSISAATFGDTSYLKAGGTLTINNVGHPSHPQIAYFESVDGREPKISNQPNDTVIFVDGRLAGGNLNIINKFGADEAFMVETPELKSTQGIFGNPPFLHSDLDVANPLAVSAVDYLIQEVPRLTLSSDFPAEVDQTIEAVGLGQKDSYWFGQKGSDEKKASDEPVEKTAETDKGSEKPSDKTVALVR